MRCSRTAAAFLALSCLAGVLWSQTPPALPAVENATTLEQEFDNGVAQALISEAPESPAAPAAPGIAQPSAKAASPSAPLVAVMAVGQWRLFAEALSPKMRMLEKLGASARASLKRRGIVSVFASHEVHVLEPLRRS
ncbi:unnamed protein product [Effrenium voratum]|nr:unnamed protein product [Effrenium voratum]